MLVEERVAWLELHRILLAPPHVLLLGHARKVGLSASCWLLLCLLDLAATSGLRGDARLACLLALLRRLRALFRLFAGLGRNSEKSVHSIITKRGHSQWDFA